jgi:signal peptidase II
MQRSSGSPAANAGLFWPVLVLVAAIDFCTKAIAATLPQGLPHSVYGEWIRFTLVHNPGAAFGLNVGQYSRWIFMLLTMVALVILGRLYVATRPGDLVRTLSLALVCGGAVGNLVDRIRWQSGVVDFIDIGFGDSRWPTFNIADMAVSLGAFLLAWVLWGEDSEAEMVSVPTAATVTGESRELT